MVVRTLIPVGPSSPTGPFSPGSPYRETYEGLSKKTVHTNEFSFENTYFLSLFVCYPL